MSSNFERLHEIINEAYAENFSILSQKLANPLFYLSLYFLIGILFVKSAFYMSYDQCTAKPQVCAKAFKMVTR